MPPRTAHDGTPGTPGDHGAPGDHGVHDGSGGGHGPARPVRRGAGELAPVAVALTTAAGCALARPEVVAGGGGVALLVAAILGGSRGARRLLPMAVAALVGALLAANAWSGLTPPRAQRYDADVVLVTDPAIVRGGISAEVVGQGRHSILFVAGDVAGPLRRAMAGERLHVAGWLEPVRDDPRLERRHIASRLTAERVGAVRPGHLPSQLANGVRRLVERGAAHLDADDRSLYLGLVVGDDRGQRQETVDEFRAAGLTHLLVVSGQNVAFVLALASPLLARLELRPRFAAVLVLITFFALVTRFEPSVLRATAMAGITALSTTVGHPTSRLRVLAYAATVCLLVDPFLVRSVGFGLSLSACAGIILLGPAISRWLPGPAWMREPVAITLAAEVGVAPLLIVVFDGVPLAALPANLLAGAAAGFVMSWGMSVGMVAGSLPSGLATVVMVPAQVAVSWISGVASWAADLPLGQVDGRAGTALLVLLGVTAVVQRRLAARRAAASHIDRVDV